MRIPESEPLLTPAEVSVLFRVDAKTVTRWAKAGKLTSIRTLGGHRRFYEAEVRALLAGIPVTPRAADSPSPRPKPTNLQDECPDCHYAYGSRGHREECGSRAA